MTSCRLIEPVQKCLAILNENGFEAYLVGGAVRDWLRGEPIHDYDITTNALPDQILTLFSHVSTIPTGLKHGTVTVIMDGIPIEITTYRKEDNYEDHRHPSAVTFTSSLQKDCARRDFTINALCFHPYEGILDFFHGEDDLNQHMIRAIGDPKKRFEEDALRILRAIRFSATLEFNIEPFTKQALFQNKEYLSSISIERIREEFLPILLFKDTYAFLKEYQEIFAVFIPELNTLSTQAWDKMIQTFSNCPIDQNLRLTFFIESFPNPSDFLRRMKFSNHDQSEIKNLLLLKTLPFQTTLEKKRLLQQTKVPFQQLISLLTITYPNQDISTIVNELQAILEHDCLTISQLEVTGKDLLEMGIPSPQIGTVLNTLLEEVITDRLENKKEDLLSWLKKS